MNDLLSTLGINFEFHHPWFLLLFLLFVPLFIRDRKSKKSRGVRVPSTQGMAEDQLASIVFAVLRWLKYPILAAMILAMARPRTFSLDQNASHRGIDIMFSIDVSYSMLAQDLQPDRLDALKRIAQRFVNHRPMDRIGLVAYAGEGLLKVPLTTDHSIVKQQINMLDPAELRGGTAIGDGLAVAVNHIKNSKAKSKVILLMTDGVQTVKNSLDPITAAKIAKDNSIKVYTIGIGSNGYAPTPTQIDFFGNLIYTDQKVKIDEATLKEIAKITGGKYFRATSNERLQSIYDEINQLEKTDIKTPDRFTYQEHFRILLWIALAFLLLDALLRWVLFKTLG